jgi:hypothetical protein
MTAGRWDRCEGTAEIFEGRGPRPIRSDWAGRYVARELILLLLLVADEATVRVEMVEGILRTALDLVREEE